MCEALSSILSTGKGGREGGREGGRKEDKIKVSKDEM
jgi:hypothetical protein